MAAVDGSINFFATQPRWLLPNVISRQNGTVLTTVTFVPGVRHASWSASVLASDRTLRQGDALARTMYSSFCAERVNDNASIQIMRDALAMKVKRFFIEFFWQRLKSANLELHQPDLCLDANMSSTRSASVNILTALTMRLFRL